jgi:phospholipid/cholesterol/gamma-HCH transport system substrate-binding protein
VQYLAPIIKNRQYNFLPFGENLVVGAAARPNEITYSEDWLRPDYNPAAHPSPAGPPAEAPAPIGPLPAEAPDPPPTDPAAAAATDHLATDPAAGLPGIMVPHGAGS